MRALAGERLELRRLLRVPPTAANDNAFGNDLAITDQMLADHIDVIELPLPDRDQGGVSHAPRLEAAELGTPQRHRRIDCRCLDHIGKRHAHAQELGHGGHLIESWAVDAQCMDIRRNGVRIEAIGEQRPRGLEGERALAVADVEQHAAFAGLQHHPFYRALRGDSRIGKGTECVGEHVARAQARNHLLVARRRMIDVRHQRQPDFPGNLERDVERHNPRGARGVTADADLDADDEIAIGVRHGDGVDRIHQPELLALADHDAVRKAENAGVRDMQIGENADLAGLDHVLAEAGEIPRAGTAGVDRRGDAGGAAKFLGIDAERGAAPIDVGVQIDQPRCDDEPRDVAHVRPRIGREIGPELDHLAAGEGDIGHRIELLGGIDHATAAQHQIKRHDNLRLRRLFRRASRWGHREGTSRPCPH